MFFHPTTARGKIVFAPNLPVSMRAHPQTKPSARQRCWAAATRGRGTGARPGARPRPARRAALRRVRRVRARRVSWAQGRCQLQERGSGSGSVSGGGGSGGAQNAADARAHKNGRPSLLASVPAVFACNLHSLLNTTRHLAGRKVARWPRAAPMIAERSRPAAAASRQLCACCCWSRACSRHCRRRHTCKGVMDRIAP